MKTREESRVGLKKYLSREEDWTGVFHLERDGKLLLKNIRIKGKAKILADHLWIDDLSDFRSFFKRGTTVSFRGIARSYKDSKGERKYNINHICRLAKQNDAMDEVVSTGAHDSKFKQKRKK